MNMKQSIEVFCKDLGLCTIGFIPARRFEELKAFYEMRMYLNLQNEFEEKDIEKRLNPKYYMPEAKTIISIAFPYYHQEEQGINGFSVYTKRLDYHQVVKKYLNQICMHIEALGGKALSFVDSNALPERYIAYLAGNGFIGRNNMLITKQYGSYVFLGEILTDLEISCEEKGSFELMGEYKQCGSCKICLSTCPTKAIHEAGCNPNICLSYITQKKNITDEEIKLLKGNVFGCDFCQSKCPYNKNITTNVLEDFTTLDYMNEAIQVYAEMDNQYFKEKISKTSCGWRGKNVIRRNAMIHMAYKGQDIAYLKQDSPYINEYIERLQKMRHIKNK